MTNFADISMKIHDMLHVEWNKLSMKHHPFAEKHFADTMIANYIIQFCPRQTYIDIFPLLSLAMPYRLIERRILGSGTRSVQAGR